MALCYSNLYVTICLMITPPNSEPREPKSTLEQAKERFRQDMLANDGFFALVAKRLEPGEDGSRHGLPDFRCEPVYRVNGDRQSWEVRLGYSRTDSDGSLTTTVSVYNYIKLATASSKQAVYQPEPELLQELTSAGVEDAGGAAEGIIQIWIAYMDMLHSDPASPVAIDPMTGTVELLDEIQVTANIIGPQA